MKWQLIDQPQKYKIKVNQDEAMGLVLVARQTGEYRLEVELLGQGARALILGIVQGKGKDSIIIMTETRHLASNTHAETMIYGTVADVAEAEINGMIKIDKSANQVTDFLTEKIILLSDKARAAVKPSLEIKANDVRASHAATVGPIDEEQAYYLMSRGISREEAEELIVAGFFQGVINKIEDDKIKKHLC